LTFQVFLAALLGIGIALSLGDNLTTDNSFYQFVLLLKSTFLSVLRMLIAPLIFFSLIGGIIGIGSVIKLQRMGAVTFAYYFSTTLIAIGLGLIAVFFIHPWTSYPPSIGVVGEFSTSRMIDPGSDSIILVLQKVLSLAFSNPVSALANLNILGIVTNALFIGIAMVLILPTDSPLFTIVRQINDVIVTILRWVIRLMPIGIFAILLDFTLQLDMANGGSQNFLTQLIQFSLLVFVLTIIHGLVILPCIAWLITGKPPLLLMRQISQPLIVAFSTSSSSATLPVSMQACEEQLQIKRSVSSFVLPLGATMNMDGTALFEAVAAIFLAYLYGIELTTVAVFTVFLMAMVSSIGAPGMPSASMAGMQMVLLAVGIPLEAIAILLVIERPLDTFRTAVNVEGDIIGALIVQRLTADESENLGSV